MFPSVSSEPKYRHLLLEVYKDLWGLRQGLYTVKRAGVVDWSTRILLSALFMTVFINPTIPSFISIS